MEKIDTDFKTVYNALLFNEWATQYKYDVHKSKCHNDGTECFNGEYFIVCAMLPSGQISNYYKLSDWDLFDIPTFKKAIYKYDGHTPNTVLARLKDPRLSKNHEYTIGDTFYECNTKLKCIGETKHYSCDECFYSGRKDGCDQLCTVGMRPMNADSVIFVEAEPKNNVENYTNNNNIPPLNIETDYKIGSTFSVGDDIIKCIKLDDDSNECGNDSHSCYFTQHGDTCPKCCIYQRPDRNCVMFIKVQ